LFVSVAKEKRILLRKYRFHAGSGSCCLELERYLKAQTFQPMNQVAGQVMLVELIQVEVAEVFVRDVL